MGKVYEVYCSAKDADPWFTVTVESTGNGVTVFDHSLGVSCERWFGKDEIESWASVNDTDAATMLRSVGVEPGKYAADRLALYLAETLDGNPGAKAEFAAIAERAGVKVNSFVW